MTHARHKLIKWWAQSFLVGIDCVVCGRRDAAGVLRSVEDMAVRSMPGMVRAQRYWVGPRRAADRQEPYVCMQFLVRFLEFASAHAVDEDVCYAAGFAAPFTHVQFRGASPALAFLPDWFLAEM